ncbi:MAG: hypothetical protein LBT80_08430 [Lactobacillaceae bacterium]|jgi:hypothetical protein|nr:hypothetical protein [Lactobacillaceae bacterium]
MKKLNSFCIAVLALGYVGALPASVANADDNENVWHNDANLEAGGYWGDDNTDQENRGMTEVDYEISPSYTITIPATMEINPAIGYQADVVALGAHPKVAVGSNLVVTPTSSNDYTLSLNSSSDHVPYLFGTSQNDDSFSADEGSITFEAAEIDGTSDIPLTKPVVATVEDIDAFRNAGKYYDQIYWTVTEDQDR